MLDYNFFFFFFSFQSFTWNLGRPVDEVEVLQLSVISRGVLKNEKVLAKYGLVLQTVVREGRIDITDFLVDLNNKPLPVSWNNTRALAITSFRVRFRIERKFEVNRSNNRIFFFFFSLVFTNMNKSTYPIYKMIPDI